MRFHSTYGRPCAACFDPLPSDAPSFATLCRRCFVNAKKRERAELLDTVESLRAELAALRCERPRSGIDRAMLRTLLQLAHPDKHGGSVAATRATQYLLTLKREAAGVAR